RVRALTVISRTSAVKLKETDWDLRRIGRELNVRYALEGSVRKAGSALRITAQLIDIDTDAHLWAEKYSGTVDDVFDLQERLSRRSSRRCGSPSHHRRTVSSRNGPSLIFGRSSTTSGPARSTTDIRPRGWWRRERSRNTGSR